MENFQTTIKELVTRLGFQDWSIDFDPEGRRVILFINEEWLKDRLPLVVKEFEHIFRLIAKKHDLGPVYVDINNYRKERENLLVELAKAAARKAVLEKKEIDLPPMNAYERRVVHMELSTRPDVATESRGEGHERCIVIKPL